MYKIDPLCNVLYLEDAMLLNFIWSNELEENQKDDRSRTLSKWS